MQILFYEDPLTDQNQFLWRAPHVQRDAEWLLALRRSGVDARMLVHSRFLGIAERSGISSEHVISANEDEFASALWSPHVSINSVFQRHFEYLTGTGPSDNSCEARIADEVCESFAFLIKQSLDGFLPDIIVTWVPAPHLRRLFPDALILHKETSVFTRHPYPLTYYLDPLGYLNASYVAKCEQNPANHSLVASAEINKLRKTLGMAFEFESHLDELLQKLSNFKRTIVVATHTNGVFFHDAACRYRSQAHLVLDVLEGVDEKCGVILTQHPDCLKLSSAEIEFLRDRFPNFLYRPEAEGQRGFGQQIIRHVDGVATVSPSVSLQALFWGKPLFVMGNNHLVRFASGVGAAGVRHPIARITDDSFIAWLVFNYSYSDDLASEPGWLANHFRQKLDHWRQFGSRGYFDRPIDDEGDVSRRLIGDAERTVMQRLGPILGAQSTDRVEMAREALFGPGWLPPENGPSGAYRWTGSGRSILRLPLAPGGDRVVEIQVGTHTGCDPDQTVTAGIGSQILASAPVSTAAPPTLLQFIVSADLIETPATTLWLEAGRSEPPYLDAHPHGLITSHIAVKPILRPHVSERRPQHSLIIPSLNGRALLEQTLPAILARCSDDVEVLISDNQSDDGTWDFLKRQTDRRIRSICPAERLDYGRHADYCYQNARGEWLSHIGDDDLILKHRFETIERIAHCGADMIFAGRIRYHWPDFTVPSLSNYIDPVAFNDCVVLMEGPSAARHLLNSTNIRHTGAVVIRRNLVEQVRTANRGVYMPERLGEYSAFRIASGLSKLVAFAQRPIVVIGRHTKSIGTILHHGKYNKTELGGDLEREIGSQHDGTGYNFLGQQPFSFEAALKAERALRPRLGATTIDYRRWKKAIEDELGAQVANGRLDVAAAEEIRQAGSAWLEPRLNRQDTAELPFGTPQPRVPVWGWRERLAGDTLGVSSIEEMASWFEAKFSKEMNGDLQFVNYADVECEWLDA